MIVKEAVVFGLFETGLSVIQSLGRKKIKVFGVDFKKDIAWYSKYSNSILCPHPISRRAEFKLWIKNNFKVGKIKLPVFISSDDFLKVFIEEYNFMKRYFNFNLSDLILLNRIEDKYEQFKLAKSVKISVPDTWAIKNKIDLNKLKHNKNWPIFVKGRDVTKWRNLFGGNTKGFTVENFKDLKNKTLKALENNIDIIAQEIIIGPDTNHYKYCSYINKKGEVMAEFCLVKIRQFPTNFGVGSLVESIENQELINLGRNFLKNISFRGIASVEFKIDEKDKKFKLIELNARYWQQNSLAIFCGIDFPVINFNDLVNQKIEINKKYKLGIKWINLSMDFNSFIDYKKNKLISFKEWISSLRGKKIISNFSFDDPLPFLADYNFGLKIFNLPRFIIKKIR